MLLPLLAAYLLLVVLITVVARRRQGRAAADRSFFVARGSLSTFTTACSLAATSIGGSSTVVMTALVYEHGLAGVWMDLAGALGFLLLGLLLARRVRETGVASIAELAALRYGAGVRRAVAVIVVLAEIGWLALLSRTMAAVLGPALPGVPEPLLLALGIAVVTAYTLVGGQFAVSYADVMQLLVMVAGLCLAAPLAALAAVGPAELAALRWDFPVSASFGWMDAGAFLVLTGLPHLVGSDIYAKVLSARDGRAAARGAMLAAALKLAFACAIAFTALCAAHIIPGQRPAEVLVLLVHHVLPGPVSAVLAIALLATMMSTASQVLLSAVTMVGNDLWPRRAAIPLATGAVALCALAAAWTVPTVVDLMKVAYTVFAAGLSLPVLASLTPRLQISRRAVIGAILGGGLSGGLLHVLRLAAVPLPGDPVLIGTFCSAVCLALGMADRRALR